MKDTKSVESVTNTKNIINYKEYITNQTFDNMNEIFKKNNISQNIVETAKKLFTNATAQKIVRGKSRIGLVALCVYQACITCNDKKNCNSIAEYFGTDKKNIVQAARKLTNNHDFDLTNIIHGRNTPIKIDRNHKIFELTSKYHEQKLIETCEYIKEICKKNNIQENIIDSAIKIYTKFSSKQIFSGSTKIGIIVLCVNQACIFHNEKIDSDDIRKYFGINKETMEYATKHLPVSDLDI